MSDPENIVDLQLDTLTRSIRFVAGAAPKATTRVCLGVALALGDVANDPAGELLAVTVADGVRSFGSTVGFVAKASADKLASTATAMKHVVDAKLQSVSSAQAEAAAAKAIAKLDKVPGFRDSRIFVVQASSEVRDVWSAAGTITVQFVDQAEPIESSSQTSQPPVADGEAATSAVIES